MFAWSGNFQGHVCAGRFTRSCIVHTEFWRLVIQHMYTVTSMLKNRFLCSLLTSFFTRTRVTIHFCLQFFHRFTFPHLFFLFYHLSFPIFFCHNISSYKGKRLCVVQNIIKSPQSSRCGKMIHSGHSTHLQVGGENQKVGLGGPTAENEFKDFRGQKKYFPEQQKVFLLHAFFPGFLVNFQHHFCQLIWQEN